MSRGILIRIHLLLSFLLVHASLSFAQSSWKEETIQVANEFGVTVVFDDVEFPDYWESWSPEWQAVPEDKRAVAVRKLKIDLAKYDPRYLRTHLEKVFLVDDLAFKKAKYGGTNDHLQKWLYLHHAWTGDDGSHAKAMGFHHEFSSIIYKTYKKDFDEDAWQKNNPEDFNYAFKESSDENLRSGRLGLLGSKELYQEGFVCEYGQLTLEDDINTFSQHLIAKPELLNAQANEYPRIKKKVKLLSDFFRSTGYAPPKPKK
ncbi:MAG: hypothetical protein AAF483_09685 [Planctomycetota bacterium]